MCGDLLNCAPDDIYFVLAFMVTRRMQALVILSNIL
jgi:hypothetical protein